ncbi:MAG TPA: hypothetical protein VGC97_15965 [Pyrinomonadaceae bacterium]|jgi:hypothetical protein
MPTELIRKQFLLTEEENLKIEQEAQSRGLSVSNLTRILHGLQPLKKGMPSKNEKKDLIQGKEEKSIIGK